MAYSGLLVSEIFHSIQGETSLAGIPFAFVRLTGCNLRCSYCDSSYAFKGGEKMEISEILAHIAGFQVQNVLLTGGEPLLQRNTIALIRELNANSYKVSIETHGEVSIQEAAPLARIVMDIKTPSSQMSRGKFVENLGHLKPNDEIKFVIGSEEDYDWAKNWIQSGKLPQVEILLSAAVPTENSPGNFPGITSTWLAESILKDRLPVRLQIQLHKLLWGKNRRGV